MVMSIQLFQHRDKRGTESQGLQTSKGVRHFAVYVPAPCHVVNILFGEQFFAFFVSFHSSLSAFVHSFFFVGSLEDQEVHERNEQTGQCQRDTAEAGILSQEETAQEEGQELRTADNVNRHSKAQSRQHLTGGGQRIGDPDRQAVHEVTDDFCAEVQAEEHRDAEEEKFEDLRPPNSHEHDAFGVAGLGIFVRLLNRINQYDTADGVQLSTQEAQRNSDGNGLRYIQTADERYGDTAQGSGSFVPNNGAAGACKGQEHRLNDSGAFHSSRHIAHDDTDHQAGHQRIAEYSAAPGIADIPGGYPIP